MLVSVRVCRHGFAVGQLRASPGTKRAFSGLLPVTHCRSSRSVVAQPVIMPRSSKSKQSTTTKPPRKPPSPPRPSASILLVSPTNEVLLLHRVQTSSSFPSAHVFPGGNCSATNDGEIPGVDDEARHRDGDVYRWAAIRETFEESGLLLARKRGQEGLLRVSEEEREKARKDIHSGTRRFKDVLAEWDAEADLGNLVPFTRWITPTNVPKRFTTQMYLYLMPLLPSSPSLPSSDEAVLPLPTSDGGIEHTAARFLPATHWLSLARADKIILFPPQFFLLHLVSQFLLPSANPEVESSPPSPDRDALQEERSALLSFIEKNEWSHKRISPSFLTKMPDGRAILGLDKSGHEIEAMTKGAKEGTSEWVVFVDFRKEGPRRVDVGRRDEVMREVRESSGKDAKL
ncbi:uncharacterized protein IWZ02DRAFT_17691 [Phyllosticta citriasiana]